MHRARAEPEALIARRFPITFIIATRGRALAMTTRRCNYVFELLMTNLGFQPHFVP
jgi:hypothetical protein